MEIVELTRTAEYAGFAVEISKDTMCVERYSGVNIPMKGWIDVKHRSIKAIGDCDFSIRVALAHEVGHAMTLPRDGRANQWMREFNRQLWWGEPINRKLGEIVISYELLAWRWALVVMPDLPVDWANACLRSYTSRIRKNHGQHV